MAASEEAMGAGHPSTYTEQPAPTHRWMEASEEAYPHGAGCMVPITSLQGKKDDQRDT